METALLFVVVAGVFGAAIALYVRRDRTKGAGFAAWAVASGWTVVEGRDRIDDSLLMRVSNVTPSTVLERAVAPRSSVVREVATYREASGRTPDELQVAVAELMNGPSVTLAFDSTNVQAPDWTFKASMLAGLAMIEVDDERLGRRWRVFAATDAAAEARAVLSADPRLREVMAGVEPPRWWRSKDREGSWSIQLPPGLSARTVARLSVEVGPTHVAVMATGRTPERREGVVQLAGALAGALGDGA